MTTTRRAIIHNRSTQADLARVQRFLPSNYTARLTYTECILIEGTDDHGWTLDGYVLPRLGSGLIAAKECDPLCEGHENVYDPRDTDLLYCAGRCYERPAPIAEWRTVTAKYSRVIMAQTLVERLDATAYGDRYRSVVRKGTSVTFDVGVREGESWWEVRMDLSEYVGACGSPSSPGTLDGVRCPASY